jgi:D-3-phosphoglycerate dehydrogenase
MKVLITDALAQEAIDKLKESHDVTFSELSPEELLAQIQDYDALIVRSRTKVTAEVIDAGVNLKVVGRAGIGVDNIDLEHAIEKGLPIVYAPTGSTQSVAELAMAHILSLARNLTQANVSIKAGKWEKKKLKGVELDGKTLGLIGCGRIGAEVAKRAQAFGMTTISYDPYLPPEHARCMNINLTDYDTVLQTSDFISIHALLTDETRGMVNDEAFTKMKPTAYIINCARGGIIDENALFNALQAGKLAGAALDVFEHEPPADSPLLGLENIAFSPHLGAATQEAQLKAGMITAEQVIKVLNGEAPDFQAKPFK